MFCLNTKIHFSLANANNSASFKRKMVLNHRFCSFTTTNKLVNEAANDSARVSGQDRKKLPALGTNQIAGFRAFRPLASSEKHKLRYLIFLRGNMVISGILATSFPRREGRSLNNFEDFLCNEIKGVSMRRCLTCISLSETENSDS